MAIEYDWNGDTDLGVDELRRFVAAGTGGRESADGTVFAKAMYFTALPVAGADVNPAMALFGLEERFRATFRFHSLADGATTVHDTALMVHTLIAFASQHDGRGVLLFNGEIAVLQYADREVVLDAEWEEWSDNEEIAPLLTQFPTRVLPQPLL
jgi:hypothetical protein